MAENTGQGDTRPQWIIEQEAVLKKRSEQAALTDTLKHGEGISANALDLEEESAHQNPLQAAIEAKKVPATVKDEAAAPRRHEGAVKPIGQRTVDYLKSIFGSKGNS